MPRYRLTGQGRDGVERVHVVSASGRADALNQSVGLGLAGQVAVDEVDSRGSGSWEASATPRSKRRAAELKDRLQRKPILTIAFGVFWGMVFFTVAVELWVMAWDLLGSLVSR
ncbi:MAG: hypothetical protein AAGB51_07390 [Planctomycetota bacterium]